MNDTFIWGLIVIGLLNLALLIVLLLRGDKLGAGEVREELRQGRAESAQKAREQRDEISKSLGNLSDLQRNQLDAMRNQILETGKNNAESLEKIRQTFDTRVKEMQDSNEKKLDQMRQTVDEKLQTTLEKRLGESFKLVSERLEAVQRGLGEMQNLATGVGDLKRVLTNVKTRGTWAEVQLGNLLEQMLVPSQFARNVKTRDDSNDLIEYAVKLPGSSQDPGNPVWLPIDSKFPQEDYLRLQEAAESGDPDAVQKTTEALAKTIRIEGERISKYLNPPKTTDFAIMFLPTEGLYAEVVRHPSLSDDLQRKFNIVVAGPTTLAALLNSFAMGFRTLAISEQSAEVWKVLGAVKTEFGKFGGILTKVKKQLDTASKSIDQTEMRAKAMERTLRGVESLPEVEATSLFPSDPLAIIENETDIEIVED